MAAATAIGMTGFFGYLSGVVSGWYLGRIVDAGGWDPAFRLIIAATGVAAVLFAICWNAGHRQSPPQVIAPSAEELEVKV